MPAAKKPRQSAIDTDSPALRPLLMHLASERGLADNSLWAYRSDLEDAEAFLATRGKSWRTIDGDDATAYLQSLSRAGRATRTVRRRFVALRVMLKYLTAQGTDKSGVLERIDKPKAARALPKILSKEQVNRLIASGIDPQSKLYLRDVAILELLYSSGLRASELCGLRLGDINLPGQFLRAFGKGRKERIVRMGRAATQTIERYLAERRAAGGSTLAGHGEHAGTLLFCSSTGGPLDRIRLYQIVRAAGERAGLGKAISPHTLRHCFASHLLGGGADLRVVQELLGHADVTTTEIYTHLDRTKLRETHAKFLPRG
jgi:integrase/recombinase XerD